MTISVLHFFEVVAVAFALGVPVGAYGHKWLARVTGAPSTLTPSQVVSAAESVAKSSL